MVYVCKCHGRRHLECHSSAAEERLELLGIGTSRVLAIEAHQVQRHEVGLSREGAAEFGVTLGTGEHRRNVVVEGLDLDAVRGGELVVGDVRLAAVRPCAPCKYLVRVTGQPAAFDALVGRGGLRCAILTSGTISVGDAVTVDAASLTRRRHLPG